MVKDSTCRRTIEEVVGGRLEYLIGIKKVLEGYNIGTDKLIKEIDEQIESAKARLNELLGEV